MFDNAKYGLFIKDGVKDNYSLNIKSINIVTINDTLSSKMIYELEYNEVHLKAKKLKLKQLCELIKKTRANRW